MATFRFCFAELTSSGTMVLSSARLLLNGHLLRILLVLLSCSGSSQWEAAGIVHVASTGGLHSVASSREVRERRLGLAPYILLTGFFQSAGALSLLGLSSATF